MNEKPLHRRRAPRVTPESLLREQEAREKLLAGLTPAEARAKRIELGMYVCPTECDDDCEAPCHESHEILTRRAHPVEICEANVARGKPPIPVDWYPTGCSCFACDGPYMPTRQEVIDGKTYAIVVGSPRPPMDEDNPRIPVRMSLCPVCGHKRCPGAADHRNMCKGSNMPGQPRSLYPEPRGEAPPETEQERRERYLANRDDPGEWG